MSGIVSFTLGIVEYFRKQKTEATIFAVVAMLFLLVACDEAWQDEHRNAEVVAAERSAAVSSQSVCQTDLRVEDAYSKGIEGQLGDARGALDKQAASLTQQQGTINSCVVSLGKMNPAINTHVSVATHVAASQTLKNQKYGFTEETVHFYTIVIMTNRKLEPDGLLKCDKSFTPHSADLSEHTNAYMVMSPTLDRIADNEYRLRVVDTGADWTEGNPLLLSATSDSDKLKCSFAPQS